MTAISAFARAAWHDYPQWNRPASRATTELEVATWSSWPDCGVGIVGGTVAALDIDIAEDGELALRIEGLARERLAVKSWIWVMGSSPCSRPATCGAFDDPEPNRARGGSSGVAGDQRPSRAKISVAQTAKTSSMP